MVKEVWGWTILVLIIGFALGVRTERTAPDWTGNQRHLSNTPKHPAFEEDFLPYSQATKNHGLDIDVKIKEDTQSFCRLIWAGLACDYTLMSLLQQLLATYKEKLQLDVKANPCYQNFVVSRFYFLAKTTRDEDVIVAFQELTEELYRNFGINLWHDLFACPTTLPETTPESEDDLLLAFKPFLHKPEK